MRSPVCQTTERVKPGVPARPQMASERTAPSEEERSCADELPLPGLPASPEQTMSDGRRDEASGTVAVGSHRGNVTAPPVCSSPCIVGGPGAPCLNTYTSTPCHFRPGPYRSAGSSTAGRLTPAPSSPKPRPHAGALPGPRPAEPASLTAAHRSVERKCFVPLFSPSYFRFP